MSSVSGDLPDFSDLPFLERLDGGGGLGNGKRLRKVQRQVTKILGAVRVSGDVALRKFARKFDGVKFNGEIDESFKVPIEELELAAGRISSELLEALKLAESRIRAHYQSQLSTLSSSPPNPSPPNDQLISEMDGLKVESRTVPVESCGVYVPGSESSYPSSVLMNVIPAQVAGVTQIIICTPPANTFPRVADEVLAAAYLSGVTEVYAVGGAQAIGAMAFGTDSIPKVDVICGPGSDYVAQAMKLVAGIGLVRVPASYAGPSEIAVILDGTADLTNLALDLLAQLEHGQDSWAWVIAWEQEVLEDLFVEIEKQLGSQIGDRKIYKALVKDREAALELANRSAPEHLQIFCEGAEDLARGVRNAGAIFCGVPTALGDYIAGPSHTLPTGGSARFAGALSCADFLKTVHIISAQNSYQDLCEQAAVIAKAEGFEMHAQSLINRTNEKSG